MTTANVQLQPGSDSSTITHHGYDPETRTFAVQFKSGLYHYYDVPQDEAADHTIAFNAKDISSGKYHNEHFKGKYRYEKVA